MDNFKVIYKILRYLEKAMDYEEVDMEFISAGKLGLTEQRWVLIMEMLADNGYVSGIRIKWSADGEASVSLERIRITLKGLEYLQENSMMQKAAMMAKGITR